MPKNIVRIKKVRSSICQVTLEDGQILELDAGLCNERLRTGLVLSEADIAKLEFDSQAYQAASRALWCLSNRDYGERELISRLVRSGFTREVATIAADQVKSLGLIDDLKYATSTAYRLFERGKSKAQVEQELMKRELSRQIVADALSETEPDPRQQLRKLLEHASSSRFETPLGAAKFAQSLLRRGFKRSDIRAVFREYHIEMEFTN